MLLENKSRYPTDEVRRLIEFATSGVNLADTAINVRNTRHATAGRAYGRTPSISPLTGRVARLIVVRMGAPERFPSDNLHGSWRYSSWGPDGAPRPADVPADAHTRRRRTRLRTIEQRWRWWVRHPYGGSRSPHVTLADWREGLVYISAHEARHIHQFRHSRPCSEVDAERFAVAAVERYRVAAAS